MGFVAKRFLLKELGLFRLRSGSSQFAAGLRKVCSTALTNVGSADVSDWIFCETVAEATEPSHRVLTLDRTARASHRTCLHKVLPKPKAHDEGTGLDLLTCRGQWDQLSGVYPSSGV